VDQPAVGVGVASNTSSCGTHFETEAHFTYDLLTLIFDVSTSKWGHRASYQFSACQALPFSAYGHVWDRQMDRQTTAINTMPPPYGGTGITILTLFNLVLVDSLDQLEVSAEESFQPITWPANHLASTDNRTRTPMGHLHSKNTNAKQSQ